LELEFTKFKRLNCNLGFLSNRISPSQFDYRLIFVEQWNGPRSIELPVLPLDHPYSFLFGKLEKYGKNILRDEHIYEKETKKIVMRKIYWIIIMM
jgi:hypothetical protein